VHPGIASPASKPQEHNAMSDTTQHGTIPAGASVKTPPTPTTPKSPETGNENGSAKDPKQVNVNDSRAERVADKAAHKAARAEQEYDKRNTIISK
jgi:hypothetical protein